MDFQLRYLNLKNLNHIEFSSILIVIGNELILLNETVLPDIDSEKFDLMNFYSPKRLYSRQCFKLISFMIFSFSHG